LKQKEGEKNRIFSILINLFFSNYFFLPEVAANPKSASHALNENSPIISHYRYKELSV